MKHGGVWETFLSRRRFVQIGAGLLVAWFVPLALPSAAPAAPGDLDPAFGSGGEVTTNFGGGALANALALQSDGKIVVAGTSFTGGGHSAFALARYNPDGSLDETFGSGGRVTTGPTGFDQANAVGIQPDGRIVAAGRFSLNFGLARYNTDGTLDLTFGSGGKVTTSFGSDIPSVNALAVQPDGKIVVAGGFFRFHLARYNPDGSLDPTFGVGGRVVTGPADFNDEAHALAVQSDGKIVVAGEATFRVGPRDLGRFVVGRYNVDGTLDPTFGSGGRVFVTFGGTDGAFALALQPDGTIVVGGASVPVPVTSPPRFALVRFRTDGTLDPTFGSLGGVTTDFGGTVCLNFGCFSDGVRALALQADGKIVAAGVRFVSDSPDAEDRFVDDFAVVRYSANGTLDPTFGNGGKVFTDFGGNDGVHALALQHDGKIVVAGQARLSGLPPSTGDFALARYLGDPLPTVAITTNQSAYHTGDRMTVTVTTDPAGATDPWYLVVALVTPVNTPGNPFFIYRFDPAVELLDLPTALSRLPAFDQIAARPLRPVTAESVVILDLVLPQLPGGAYQWLAALFSADLKMVSHVALGQFTFQ